MAKLSLPFGGAMPVWRHRLAPLLMNGGVRLRGARHHQGRFSRYWRRVAMGGRGSRWTGGYPSASRRAETDGSELRSLPACPGGKCERGPSPHRENWPELAAARPRRAREFRFPKELRAGFPDPNHSRSGKGGPPAPIAAPEVSEPESGWAGSPTFQPLPLRGLRRGPRRASEVSGAKRRAVSGRGSNPIRS